MNALTINNTTSGIARRRRGLTLVEVMVAMAIIAILLSILVVSGRAVLRSQNRSDANQEIQMIAAAIDKYANFWPAWEIADMNGNLVKVADRGWPDYLPGRLFDASMAFLPESAGTFNSVANGFTFNVDNSVGLSSGLLRTPGQIDQIVEGNVLNANICLTYALTAKTGQGPYLVVDDSGAIIREVSNSIPVNTAGMPQPRTNADNNLHAASIAGRKMMLVDPWGTPYRYFWVHRDNTTPSGLSPVVNGSINMPQQFRRAVGYVLESAGPDRKFGDRWTNNTNVMDANEAADNLIIQRP